MVKNFEIHYMVSFFFAKFVLTKRGKLPTTIFQLDVVHNLPTKLSLKSLGEKLLLFSIRPTQIHLNALLSSWSYHMSPPFISLYTQNSLLSHSLISHFFVF
jgi:hypothetical protein